MRRVNFEMMSENINVVCCFCGESLLIDSSIQISFSPMPDMQETQTLYAHPLCFDKSLHLSIPRLIEKTQNVD